MRPGPWTLFGSFRHLAWNWRWHCFKIRRRSQLLRARHASTSRPVYHECHCHIHPRFVARLFLNRPACLASMAWASIDATEQGIYRKNSPSKSLLYRPRLPQLEPLLMLRASGMPWVYAFSRCQNEAGDDATRGMWGSVGDNSETWY